MITNYDIDSTNIESMIRHPEHQGLSDYVVVGCQPITDILDDQTATSQKLHQCLGSGENFPYLKDILPISFNYIICEFNRFEPFEGQEERFEVLLRVAATTEEEAVRWLEEFQLSSKITWRVDKTYPDSQKKLIFKKVFHCQHNTRSTSHKDRNVKGCHKKNTNCPSILTITVKKYPKLSRSKDPHCREFAMVVALRQTHNHLVNDTDALQHRPVSADVRLKFTRLFAEGLRPPKALLIHRQDLKRDLPVDDLYRIALADRALCPDIQWCYRLYYKVKGKNGDLNSDRVVTAERLDRLESSLRASVDDLCSRIRRNPETLVPPVEHFLSTLRTVNDEGAIAELFRSFTVPTVVKTDREVKDDSGIIPVQVCKVEAVRVAVDDPSTTSPAIVRRSNGDGKYASRKRGRPRKAITAYHTHEHAYSSTLPNKHPPQLSSLLQSNGLLVQTGLSVIPVSCYSNSAPTTINLVGRLFGDIPADAWAAAYVSDGGRQFITNEEMQYTLCEEVAVQHSIQNIEYRTADVAAMLYNVDANNGLHLIG